MITHVSDTALWVAAFRARETARPDAIFRDHLAARLAGERGEHILESIPHTEAMAFALAIRTVAIDRLVQETIALGVDTVINIAAGMDTRPYRLALPQHLRWIEIDYPHVLEYKEAQLKDERPNCQLERIPADLADASQRRKLFADLGARTKNATIITEGFIAYLKNDDAAAISHDLFGIPSFRYWIQDFYQGKKRNSRHSREIAKHLENAPWQFTVSNPVEWFSEHGWKVHQKLFVMDEADRVGRDFPPLFPWHLLLRAFPRTIRKLGNKSYGYVTLTHPAGSIS